MARFQFTLPCRERRAEIADPKRGVSFNSRSRVGSDKESRDVLVAKVMFQFTLPCRERPADHVVDVCDVLVSIHAPV